MLRLARLAASVLLLAMPAASVNLRAESPLIEAVKALDRTTVRTLLQKRADVNAAEADGTTALYWAAEKSDPELVELLIRAAANPNAKTRYGFTPLAMAAVNGNAAIVEKLLTSGADANTATPEGETVLMMAARTGVAPAVQLLLSHGANPNATETSRGQTALMWAAGEGHVQCVEALIRSGANIKARSAQGWTALLFAARDGRKEAVRVLLDAGVDVNESLERAARFGRGGGAGGAAGASDATRGASALLLAAGSNHYELATYLLERGADPNSSNEGWTALHLLTWMRKPAQTASIGPHGSGTMDSLELARRLVAHGADVNARMRRRAPTGTTDFNMVGATPFIMAARTGDAPMMRLLASLGADPLLPNEDNTTPLMAAAGLGTHEPGADPGTEAEAFEAVKLALELGNDVNAVNKDGDTAMHGAAYKQFPSVVRYLAEHGADVSIWNRKNKQGWSPLRIAVGVHRGMHFRGSAPTAEAVRGLLAAAGLSTEVEPEPLISGAVK
jgi:ankyrin repeat protein